jgi:hypothetical protein
MTHQSRAPQRVCAALNTTAFIASNPGAPSPYQVERWINGAPISPNEIVKEVETKHLTVSLTKVHSGLTITSAVCHPVQMRESRDQSKRSVFGEPQPSALGALKHLQLVP